MTGATNALEGLDEAVGILHLRVKWANESSPGGSGAIPTAIVWRDFSVTWMASYSAALATLYSAVASQSNSSAQQPPYTKT